MLDNVSLLEANSSGSLCSIDQAEGSAGARPNPSRYFVTAIQSSSYAGTEEFVSRGDADVVAEVVVAADLFHPERLAVGVDGLEVVRARVGRRAVPVLDAGTRPFSVALVQRARALAALLHAADAFVQEEQLAAGVAVPVRPLAGLPDRARRRRAVDHDLRHRLGV